MKKKEEQFEETNEVEDALIGRLFNLKGCIRSMQKVGPDDFQHPINKKIAGIFWSPEVLQKGKINIAIAFTRAKAAKVLPYLLGLQKRYAQNTDNVLQLAETVQKASQRVKLRMILLDSLQKLALEDANADEIGAKTSRAIKAMTQSSSLHGATHRGPEVEKVFNEFEERLENPEKENKTTYETGIAPIDKVIGGYEDGDLIFVQARPSHGKSAVELQMAIKAAERGEMTAVYSFETTKEKVARRIISYYSGYSPQEISTASPNDGDKIRMKSMILAAKIKSKELPLHIYDKGGDFKTIQTDIYRMYGEGCKRFFFDYFQLMKGLKEKGESRPSELKNIAEGLKAIQKDCEAIPVFVLAVQASSICGTEKRIPEALEADGCKSAEQAADKIISLNIPSKYDSESYKSSIMQYKIVKNRDGEIGKGIIQINPGLRMTGEEEFEDSNEDLPF